MFAVVVIAQYSALSARHDNHESDLPFSSCRQIGMPDLHDTKTCRVELTVVRSWNFERVVEAKGFVRGLKTTQLFNKFPYKSIYTNVSTRIEAAHPNSALYQ